MKVKRLKNRMIRKRVSKRSSKANQMKTRMMKEKKMKRARARTRAKARNKVLQKKRKVMLLISNLSQNPTNSHQLNPTSLPSRNQKSKPRKPKFQARYRPSSINSTKQKKV